MAHYFIDYGPGVAELVQEFFGFFVTGAELAAACGALEGAAVALAVSRLGVLVQIRHPYLLAQERSLRRDRTGRLFIFNHEFTKRSGAPHGLARQMLLLQVPAAHALGFSYLETWAAGDPRSASRNGYYTWAALGFNAPLTIEQQRALPPDLSGARTLNELMLGNGEEWWRKMGSSVE